MDQELILIGGIVCTILSVMSMIMARMVACKLDHSIIGYVILGAYVGGMWILFSIGLALIGYVLFDRGTV